MFITLMKLRKGKHLVMNLCNLNSRYKILKAELTNGKGEVGEVLDDYLEISCGNKKSIKVLEIQRQGKRPQNIGEFMLGSQIKKGSNLNNA